jgi:alkylhydroperoxidase/carboxymuconolactone decarboxylase family protein YurZ
MPAKDLTTILTATELQTITSSYNAVTMGALLAKGLTDHYPAISPYLGAIGQELYPEFKPQPAGPLSAANRERCLVALLASRSRRLELAIHIYLALVNGVSTAELAHICVASGIYTGVDTVGSAFDVMQATLEKLQALAQANAADPLHVLIGLASVFPS